MSERNQLTTSIRVCGYNNNTKKEFIIEKTLGEGGSSICYTAYCTNGSNAGVLKEFYPTEEIKLVRRDDKQLVAAENTQEAKQQFEALKKEYVAPFLLLQEKMKTDEGRELATFIPDFEIYCGCAKNNRQTGTVYIWTGAPELKNTFEDICKEIHSAPDKEPAKKAVTVLRAIESLTKCVGVMHNAGIIHMDIKPENFGFKSRGDETLIQNISFFDVNSIRKNGETCGSIFTTPGFADFELRSSPPSPKNDIYSIGATLFYALITPEDADGYDYCYNDKLYDNIKKLVKNSTLIKNSDVNSHPFFVDKLTAILQKCLCQIENRYKNCGELLADIQQALSYLLPAELFTRLNSNEKQALKDLRKYWSTSNERNSMTAILYHLYEHPVYEHFDCTDSTMNVLLLGFGKYGQKFADACLQVCQLPDIGIDLTVISDNKNDREMYLNNRPEIKNFFTVDGENKKSDNYGEINFKTNRLPVTNASVNPAAIQKILQKYCKNKHPHYIFIALGNDELNAAIAHMCYEMLHEMDKECTVNFVQEKSESKTHCKENIYPVFVNADIKKSALHKKIERMAFNVHILWKNNLNIDFDTVKAEFRKPYNHNSCVSNVISMKYKLYSLSIDLEYVGLEEAADIFASQYGTDTDSSDILNDLIWAEHRRWVTEKICLGWTRLTDLKKCINGPTKNEKTKEHVCIVKSTKERPLESKDWSKKNWDSADKSTEDLDSLDRLSVTLHRIYKNAANTLKSIDLPNCEEINAIRNSLNNKKKALVAFNEWYTCIQDMWADDAKKAKLYKGLKEAFTSSLDEFDSVTQKRIKDLVELFNNRFTPILASLSYQNWKNEDVKLIENIPFILTHDENSCLFVPYSPEADNKRFNNVAAATVINPKKLVYIYMIDDSNKNFDGIAHIIEYLRKKKIRSSVEFIIAYPGCISDEEMQKTEKALTDIDPKIIKNVKLLSYSNPDDIADELIPVLKVYIKKTSRSNSFFAVERNSSATSGILQGAGFYKNLPSYKFDSNKNKFESLSCDMLKYIKTDAFISVSEMLSLQLSSGESINQSEFSADYKFLFNKYKENKPAWKSMCAKLGEYEKKAKPIASFKKDPSAKRASSPEKVIYYCPYYCSESIAKIITELKKYDIIEQGSYITTRTNNSCKVEIHDCLNNKAAFDELFSNYTLLLTPDNISVIHDTGDHKIKVIFDDLRVSDAETKDDTFASEGVPTGTQKILKVMADKYYISNYKENGTKVSFSYSSHQIKELLTTAGKVLEIYVYHKALEVGFFDDVVNSLKIGWEDTDVTNEIDCLITKNFRSLFIECKATNNLSQDYYYKLSALANRFGINTTAVIIADTNERPGYDEVIVNSLQRTRGAKMNIITIYKHDEIANIGETLKRVIRGTYTTSDSSF